MLLNAAVSQNPTTQSQIAATNVVSQNTVFNSLSRLGARRHNVLDLSVCTFVRPTN